jgi:hypothetical protein
MKTCPACAEQISSNAETCPHCGVSVHDYAAPGGSSGGGKKTSGTMIVLIVVGAAFMVFVVCGGVLTALLLPAVQQAREAARRTQCQNNLRQIGLALLNYESAYATLPPAYIADASGKPMHSWRVLILPFIDQAPLHSQYDFDEPWDGPNNSRLLSQMPSVYACPSHSSTGLNTNTAYAAVFGERCIFRGTEPVGYREIIDGTSNTLMIVEASRAGIPWMKPDDIDITKHPALGDPDGFSSDHTGGVHGLMADGAVHFLSQNINVDTLKALFTRDGGEAVGNF